MIMKVIIINGPNLNLLSERNSDIYGGTSFGDFFQKMLFIKIFRGTNKSVSSFNYTLLNKSIDNKINEYAENFTSKDIVHCLRYLQNIDLKIKTLSTNDKSILTNFIFTSLSNE